ncbi:ferric/cupric reductase transmembrane component-like protein 6 [Elsinoe australis]|uniref:Ferric/cupric reductase transmembrane component-like protein 6 n=1 Tax=Elsinoe australis TaxID=40998 RepID=A0A4U7AUE1_9PEZI|nr:ferric/cupric reductase transmembrane component-like protein 6 [Elsinoe australis]
MRFLLLVLSLFGAAHGLIGVGIEMYNPVCAHACRSPLASLHLSCTDESHSPSGGHHSSATGPDCFAKDTPFLTTLAWCMQSRCAPDNVEAWRLEKYWDLKATGDETIPPRWTYAETLNEISRPPTTQLNSSEPLEFTSLTSDDDYLAARIAMASFEEQETYHSRFGLVLLLVGAGSPVLLTWLGSLPIVPRIYAKLSPYIVMPAFFRKYHVQALPYSLGNAPTSGQAVYIFLFLLLTIIVTAVPYKSHSPNSYFEDSKSELLSYIANRTGVLAFALFPLTILFAGRNNILLYITSWSHSTYMLLHRWMARILTVQIILHSILEVVMYKHMGEYSSEVKEPYWIWGIVGTVLASLMLVISTLWFRRASYEIFLVLHIVLAALVLIGSWYHVELLFTRKWGYQNWLYAAFAIWFFDRMLRVISILRTGKLNASVREIGDDIVRIDIEGVRWGLSPGQHCYAYFPGLKRRFPWECHPFSVIALLNTRSHPATPDSASESASTSTPTTPAADIEKALATSTSRVVSPHNIAATSGIRLYARRHKGLTRSLAAQASQTVLLEGPYHNHNLALPDSVLHCDRLLLIAGGIGITGVAAFAAAHPRTKLYWSVREETRALVEDVRESGVLGCLGREKLVLRVGGESGRWDFGEVMGVEARAGERTGVVVCGPPGFCDDVRDAVARIGRQGRDVRLVVEAFSW